ncbi:EAL domain-containing protein [Janthinobacterium sp. 17J80-10]|uniref:EAL domain-containing protein n=1 Tax=Janthinobacterium sp. 17J80-10 TaxID=2497863 RepID=UPI0013E8D9EA|nr:EAL domain-containing protein [Janthinobacterium sp. 17J80-10]
MPLALSLARLVKQVHVQRPFHGCINPFTLALTPGFAGTTADVLLAKAGNQQLLAYTAPEQLGRIGKTPDARSDLYALGVVLYELATGQVPFRGNDPIELAHCHIAHLPVPPQEIRADIAPAFGNIILKLLKKDPEERYQSCDGLIADLAYCMDSLADQGRMPEFALGRHDFSGRLQLPGNLLGREAETRTLFQAYSRVSRGATELVLISGYSGIGKSRLAREIAPTIVAAGGIYLSGKFDQYKRNIPYVTIVQAIQEFIRRMLSEPEAKVAAWRAAIQDAVGSQGNLLVDVVPELTYIIGPQQSPAVLLDPSGAENRLLTVFRKFISVLATAEHPLVLFLDDLQWIDAGSRKLLEDLVTHADVRHLLLIGAYRNEELDPHLGFAQRIETIRSLQGVVHEIHLGPLSQDIAGQLIASMLGNTPAEAASLTALLHAKTGGNPFFIVQFLAALSEDRALEFNPQSRAWQWDIERIRAMSLTDNVIELMVESLRRLSEGALELLKVLACLGTTAQVSTLQAVLEAPPESVEALLDAVERTGLIRQADGQVKFAHDRIHEAAYSLIPQAERAARHLEIGRKLLSQVAPGELDQRIFDLAYHFNAGLELVADESERASVCQLNRTAGARARASAAFQAARDYLAQAIALLPPTAWEDQHAEAFELHLDCGECASVIGNFEQAERLLDKAAVQARSNHDRARVARVRARMYHFWARGKDCMRVGLETLALFGVSFPQTDEALHAYAEKSLQELDARIMQHGIDALIDLPRTTDPEVRIVIGLMAELLTVAYSTQPAVALPLLLKGLELSLTLGYVEESCALYNNYALLRVGLFGDLDAGYAYSELALRLNARFNDPKLRGRLMYIYGYAFAGLRRPWRQCLPILEDAFKACCDAGHIGFAGASIDAFIWTAWESGLPLATVKEMAAPYRDLSRVTNTFQANCVIAMLELLFAKLQGTAEKDSDAAFLKQIDGASWNYTLGHFYITQQISHYILGNYDKALESAHAVKVMPGSLQALTSMVTHHFYHALTLTALHDRATYEQQQDWKGVLQQKAALLQKWAERNPENYGARYKLVAAEIARIDGQAERAVQLYEQAIMQARASKNLHDAAIAGELASRYFQERGLPMTASAHLAMARNCWLRWGATAKAAALQQAFPAHGWDAAEFIPASTAQPPRFPDLDILTAAKAAQAVSGEIELNRLTQSLLRAVLQNAGADRGVLLLSAGTDYRIVAEAVTDDGAIHVILNQAPVTAEALPGTILQYVTRTGERILLDDATQHHSYSADPYLEKHRPKSLLCLPLLKQAKLVGALYLENRLTGSVFTQDRLAMLELLTAQAVISLENATLYDKLHTENSERKRIENALKSKTQELEAQASFMNAVIENIPVAVFVKDARNEFRYTLWNRAAEEIFRIPKEAVLGKKTDEIWADEDIAQIHASDQAVAGTRQRIDIPEQSASTRQQDTVLLNTIKVPILNRADGEVEYLLGISDDITERKRSESLIWQQANFDSLTGLPNRSHFRDRLLEAMGKSRAEDSKIAVLFIDLDRFKEVNDSLGHACGDMLLVAAARRISDCVRTGDIVARLGGDEFTVVLSQLDYPGHIEEISQRIIDALAVPFQLGNDQAYISASIGITVYPDDASDIDELVKRADQALYIAKDSGRNQFGYFTPAMQMAAIHRMRLTNDLRGAIERDELQIYFQPIMALATGRIEKAEALLRWRHPQLGLIDPAEFVPLAESSGLILHFGDWVFQKVARAVKHWRTSYCANFQISINQSPLEFQRHDDRYARWLATLEELEISGQGMVIEITEGLLLDASSNVTEKLLKLRQAGVQVALDDFGTGYSSLAYLKKFHIDYLKIDRAFTQNLEVGSDNLALCEAIIVMAHKLGLKVIAEGVETLQQHELLQVAGCDFDQGYLFARPLPEDEFDAMLMRSLAA